GDYTLTFSKPNEVSSTLCWSAKTETSELGALRNQVEETAHLAYVKSMAYWRCGRFLRREKKEFTAAMKVLRLGVETLGYRYAVREGVLDDTHIGILCAIQEEKEGRLNSASYYIEETLWGRLHIYGKDLGVQIPNYLKQASYPVFNPSKDY
ncbi:MAG: hypothetical protein VSS75_000320, partial [Candidatus Parabeggiatoa sp.]|nr:hypothetical protein [Candidatus Parabeggiatoa sp.]